MGKRRRIGFNSYNEDDNDGNSSLSESDRLKDILKLIYKPNGFTEEKEFKSASEIAYELSDTIDVTTKQVAEAMQDLNFEITNIEQQICFVVFVIK